MEPEYYRELSRDGESVTFKPFLRLDSLDSERTHFDLRELYWRKAARRWELVAGYPQGVLGGHRSRSIS